MARGRQFVKKMDNLRWIGLSAMVGALSAGSQAVTALASGSIPETLLRIRGELMVWFDGPSAEGKHIVVSCGLLVVSAGQGTTVVLNPGDDAPAPWLWYWRGSIGYEEVVADVVDVPALTAARVVVDNKSMRKLRPEREIQFVVTNGTGLAAASVNVSLNGRMLLGS